jgi:2-polyprenyl-3-methyl-5-hydroxy-6-metoxy-1,4-benzoquinol methylase
VRVIDLEETERLPWPERSFDVILAADVVEHLRDPARALGLLRRYLQPEGRAIVSVPNVAHLSVRIPLLFGQFRYGESGILDETHLHLFTFRTASELVESCRFHVESVFSGSNRFGGLLNSVPPLRWLLRGLFAYSIVLVGRPIA